MLIILIILVLIGTVLVWGACAGAGMNRRWEEEHFIKRMHD